MRQHFGVEPRVSLAEQLEVVAAQLADEYWLDNSGDILGIVDGSFLEGYDEFTVGVKFRNAAVVSLTHSLLTRCGFEPENYLDARKLRGCFRVEHARGRDRAWHSGQQHQPDRPARD